jgi:hypothetical protein
MSRRKLPGAIFKLRMPPGIKAWVELQADANGRTLTDEVLARLEAAKASEGAPKLPASAGGDPAAGKAIAA